MTLILNLIDSQYCTCRHPDSSPRGSKGFPVLRTSCNMGYITSCQKSRWALRMEGRLEKRLSGVTWRREGQEKEGDDTAFLILNLQSTPHLLSLCVEVCGCLKSKKIYDSCRPFVIKKDEEGNCLTMLQCLAVELCRTHSPTFSDTFHILSRNYLTFCYWAECSICPGVFCVRADVLSVLVCQLSSMYCMYSMLYYSSRFQLGPRASPWTVYWF